MLLKNNQFRASTFPPQKSISLASNYASLSSEEIFLENLISWRIWLTDTKSLCLMHTRKCFLELFPLFFMLFHSLWQPWSLQVSLESVREEMEQLAHSQQGRCLGTGFPCHRHGLCRITDSLIWSPHCLTQDLPHTFGSSHTGIRHVVSGSDWLCSVCVCMCVCTHICACACARNKSKFPTSLAKQSP